MTKYRFVQLCASEEGYGITGAVPTRDMNPIDLRHSPHSWHAIDAPEAIGVMPSAELGWEDADRQAELWAERGLTLRQAIYTLAPPIENNTSRYLNFVTEGLQKSVHPISLQTPHEVMFAVYADMPMTDAIKIPAVTA